MSKKTESAIERIKRLKEEQDAANQATAKDNDLLGQLTHESTGESNLAEIAKKLKQRQDEEKTSVMANTIKYTIYVDEDVAEAFNALCLKRGDQRKFVNQALREFVEKKAKELGN